MAICLSIHFKHNFSNWGNHASCVDFLNSAADSLVKAFSLSKEQVAIHALSDKDVEEMVEEEREYVESEGRTFGPEQEKEERADINSNRYEICIDSSLWLTCHLEKDFWQIDTCEAYSFLFDEEPYTREFVKQIICALGGHTAYITEEMAEWLCYASPDTSFEDWLKKVGNPYIVEV